MDHFLSPFEPTSSSESSNSDLDLDNNKNALPPEPQVGNVEYKLKIVNPTKQRFEHLVTQLKWRLREGNGEAIYEIGVEDSGNLAGLSQWDMKKSLHTLNEMANKLGATTTILKKRTLKNGRSVAEVLLRKVPEDQNYSEVRIAVLGNADAGKSTLLGVLTQGSLDNGRGCARLGMFRHLHEIQTGHTSSISHEILGFNSRGKPINYSYSELITAEEICDTSTKLVNFLDLAGHRKYIRTTIQGLCGYLPDHAMLVIPSTTGAVGMAYEHLAIVVALNLPFFIVVTKIDLVEPDNILNNLENFLKDIDESREPLVINSLDDAVAAGANQSMTDNVVPIFCISSVTGKGLDLLTRFLHVLPPSTDNKEREQLDRESPEFQIVENFNAGDIGQVLGGLLTKGIVTEGSKMQIGPFEDGFFKNVTVRSIHRNRVPCRTVRAGQSAAICLDISITGLRSGMVLLSADQECRGCLYFQATVTVLSDATAIYQGFQTTVYIGNIRQTAIVIGIFKKNCLHTNETASILFKFKVHPEYVSVGQRLLFCEGSAKGIGKIKQIFPLNYDDPS